MDALQYTHISEGALLLNLAPLDAALAMRDCQWDRDKLGDYIDCVGKDAHGHVFIDVLGYNDGESDSANAFVNDRSKKMTYKNPEEWVATINKELEKTNYWMKEKSLMSVLKLAPNCIHAMFNKGELDKV